MLQIFLSSRGKKVVARPQGVWGETWPDISGSFCKLISSRCSRNPGSPCHVCDPIDQQFIQPFVGRCPKIQQLIRHCNRPLSSPFRPRCPLIPQTTLESIRSRFRGSDAPSSRSRIIIASIGVCRRETAPRPIFMQIRGKFATPCKSELGRQPR